MTTASGAVCALVDWGTSRVRLWLAGQDASVVGEARSDEGMGRLRPDQFPGALERLMARAGAPAGTCAMLCGMVGSRQGWREAPYLPIPARLDDLPARALHVDHAPRPVAILPGLADFDDKTPDVIRGEETKLLGLLASGMAADNLILMPGTHAKWARIDARDRAVAAFATSLSGDAYAALGEASVLKHSIGGAAVDPAHPAFAAGVAASLEEPRTFLSRLFRVRARSILQGADAAADLSGAIIGMDIAGALHRFGRPAGVTLIGSGGLGPLYERALAVAGLPCTLLDGDELVRHGLSAAARATWPNLFTEAASWPAGAATDE